ncbi:MAG: beta-ribofuranosylaminobenzene 5'-phosphate synthase family protein [Planctomycetaceae bacterium]
MSRRIVVTTGARLHFGLLSNRAESGRNFGGAGLMIDSPGFQIAARHAEQDRITAHENYRCRIEDVIAAYRRHLRPEMQPSACEIELIRPIPPHVGLGSGTQLAMAVAKSFALLANDAQADAATLAEKVGRGKRSSIGIHGFDRGGFLVDGGKLRGDVVGTDVARFDFPSDWRIVLVTPRNHAGLSGERELDAFRRLPGMLPETSERLRGLVQSELVPAVVGREFERFCEALYNFGRIVGEYFAAVQGGVYADATMTTLVQELRSAGVPGVGQTSWGPTIFALAPSAEGAASLAGDLETSPYCRDADVWIATPRNTGAKVEIAG